jgi:hypothetical protein
VPILIYEFRLVGPAENRSGHDRFYPPGMGICAQRLDPVSSARVDFALFMVAALENDELVQEAPTIVGCRTPSALRMPLMPGHRLVTDSC